MSLTLDVSATFPDGTSVGVYGINTQSADTRAAPGGTPVETATVSSGAVTLNQVVEDRSYLLIGWVSGEWRRTGFTVNEEPDPLVIRGVEVATKAQLDALDSALADDIADGVSAQEGLDAAITAEADARETNDAYIGRWVEQLSAFGKGYVYAGDDGSAARPPGFASVDFVTTDAAVTDLDNAEIGDHWIDKATGTIKIKSAEPEQRVVTAFPSSVAVADVSGGGLTNPANVEALDGVYATCAASSTRVASAFGNFGFDTLIPVGATIDKVELIYTYFVGSNAGTAFGECHAKIGGTGGTFVTGGWFADSAEPLTLAAVTVDLTAAGNALTRANLLNGSFVAYLAGRASAGGPINFSFDSLICRVTYTTAVGDSVIIAKEDDCTDPNFTKKWGPASSLGTYGDAYGSGMATTDRVVQHANGGDTFPKLDGSPSSGAYYEISILDADERTELGHNSQGNSFLTDPAWTMFRFYEGETYKIGYSIRVPSVGGLNLAATLYQLFAQFKQTGASVNSSGTPVFSHHGRSNQWQIWQSDDRDVSNNSHSLWGCDADYDVWTRFIWTVTFSQDPAIGRLQLEVDNGTEQFDSGVFETYTLKRETTNATYPNGGPNQTAGQSIPSHLRAGAYKHPSNAGGKTHLANIQIATIVSGSWVTLIDAG